VVLAAQIATPPAEAQCVAPTLEARPASASPGSWLRINGQFFADGCNDVIGCTAGQACTPPPAPPPYRDIRLVFVSGEHEWPLASVDGYDFSVQVHVPSDVHTGRARIEARTSDRELTRLDFDVDEGPAVIDEQPTGGSRSSGAAAVIGAMAVLALLVAEVRRRAAG
jgi:hypothetical protein